MSRSQQTNVYDTAKQEESQNEAATQKSQQQAQQDIGNFTSALSKYAASNPYVQGGEFQTSENKMLSNTADANADSARAMLQSQAQRTGQNPAAANAAAEEIARQSQRTLSGQEGQAEKERIGSEAGYNKNVLDESKTPEQMQEQLAALQQGAAASELSEEEQAAAGNKSFGDTFGGTFASGLGNLAAGSVGSIVGCWIAAELYGGWSNPRTILLRQWIFGPFAQSWYGNLLSAMYLKTGQRVAGLIKRNRSLRFLLQRLFDQALKQAQKWEANRGF